MISGSIDGKHVVVAKGAFSAAVYDIGAAMSHTKLAEFYSDVMNGVLETNTGETTYGSYTADYPEVIQMALDLMATGRPEYKQDW